MKPLDEAQAVQLSEPILLVSPLFTLPNAEILTRSDIWPSTDRLNIDKAACKEQDTATILFIKLVAGTRGITFFFPWAVHTLASDFTGAGIFFLLCLNYINQIIEYFDYPKCALASRVDYVPRNEPRSSGNDLD